MNLVVITADDLSFFTLGFVRLFPDYTPNINRLAQNGYTFFNAHCNIPFCQPSRSVLFTGKYPQNNGSTEFNPISVGTATLSSILRKNGYQTAIIGKEWHHRPLNVYNWDHIFRDTYGLNIVCETEKFISTSSTPFFLLVNIDDPHRPFIDGPVIDDIFIPPFLPNTKTIAKELSCYLRAVERLDFIVNGVLNLIDIDNTIVVFTSDHGMSFPYVKGNCYNYSTNIPLIYSGNNIVNKVDMEHLVSHVDFLPTILNCLEITCDERLDGRSYSHLLTGNIDVSFNSIYSQLNRMHTGPDIRMRSVTTISYNYVFNIDNQYPGRNVDGWGFDATLTDLDAKFWVRPQEELHKYTGLKSLAIDDLALKTKMKNLLLDYLLSYNDPAYYWVLRSKIKLM